MITLLTSVLARAKGWAIGALALLAAIGSAFFVGRSKGHNAAQTEAAASKAKSDMAAMNDALDAVQERNHVEAEISRNHSTTSAERLSDNWSRD